MARAVIALVALFAVTTWVHSQDPPPRVQALGLEIRKPLPPGVDSELEDFRPQGTTIRLVIDLPDKHIVDVDPEASKVSHFKDDKGSDLLKADKGSGLGRDDWLWAHFLRVSKNGKQCSIEPSAPGVPAVGATKVKLKGIIVLLCGSEEKSVEAKDVVLDDKLNLDLGPFTLRKDKAFSGDKPSLVFDTKQNKHIRSVKLRTADGKEIEPQRTVRVRASVLNKTENSWWYSLAGVGERCNVRVTFFDKVEAVTVPVDLEIGVGF